MAPIYGDVPLYCMGQWSFHKDSVTPWLVSETPQGTMTHNLRTTAVRDCNITMGLIGRVVYDCSLCTGMAQLAPPSDTALDQQLLLLPCYIRGNVHLPH